MTLMFWINTNIRKPMAVLSYDVKENHEEFFLGFEREWMIITMNSCENLWALIFYVFNSLIALKNLRNKSEQHIFFPYRKLAIPPISDGFWHHVLIILFEGNRSVYLNGIEIFHDALENASLPILRGGGVFAIGQKLMCDNAVSDPKMSFVGNISFQNFWISNITRNTLFRVMSFAESFTMTGNENGSVINGFDFQFFVFGNVSKVSSSCSSFRHIFSSSEYTSYNINNL